MDAFRTKNPYSDLRQPDAGMGGLNDNFSDDMLEEENGYLDAEGLIDDQPLPNEASKSKLHPVPPHLREPLSGPSPEIYSPAKADDAFLTSTPTTAVVPTDGIRREFLLRTKTTVSNVENAIFCLKFSEDSQMLACGCADGKVRVYHSASGRVIREFNTGTEFPVTSIDFRPNVGGQHANVILSVTCQGHVQHWHPSTGKCIHAFKLDQELYACAFNADGTKFAIGGKGSEAVMIYDENSKTQLQSLRTGDKFYPGSHFNRVFSIKFHPQEPNMVLSAGWDRTIQIWDMRSGQSVRSIYGANVCGDAMDIDGDTVLTGSWRTETQLETWDYRTTEKMGTIEWGELPADNKPAMLYCACFGDGGRYIAAGGSEANEGKVFDLDENRIVGYVSMNGAIYACTFSRNGRFVAWGGAGDQVKICEIQ